MLACGQSPCDIEQMSLTDANLLLLAHSSDLKALGEIIAGALSKIFTA